MSQTYTKHLGILVKREDMTYQRFTAGTHVKLRKWLPGLRRYSVNLVDRERLASIGYDGFSKLWFDFEDDLDAAFGSPGGKILLADLPNFNLAHRADHLGRDADAVALSGPARFAGLGRSGTSSARVGVVRGERVAGMGGHQAPTAAPAGCGRSGETCAMPDPVGAVALAVGGRLLVAVAG